ncbi:hypothetical protein HanXRQr2_Chr07g0316231 [Helianthus annuus]|uniref:Uncharacterized protein n=1 Tax=Helianthus annuus TaxID=4232 RepID=A0A251UF19_HELAN|nr:uncharacterized protein LOC110869251 [Helianthus annuus]KAF5800460.1 hypothetical protein HanXRQr2_Chr07g0316231 [Helianthus annuus]KAJ0906446.1 hypothetical protein HanPSC8_Chr07g0305491 [Helianthus annuus]
MISTTPIVTVVVFLIQTEVGFLDSITSETLKDPSRYLNHLPISASSPKSRIDPSSSLLESSRIHAIQNLSLATLDLGLHSKYVRIALEGQPTIVVDDLFVMDHFILNAQTRRLSLLCGFSMPQPRCASNRLLNHECRFNCHLAG